MRKMKDSGIEWIGEIPENWKIRRIKTLFQLRNEKSFKPLNEVNLISLYTDKGVLQHSDIEYVAGNKASNADGYKCVYEDDIVVNIILCWMGAIGRSAYTGVTSPAYDIYKPCPGTDSRFYHYYFRTKGFNGECFQRGRGIMLMRWRTYAEDFMDIKVCFPSLSEQQQIADFLDCKCSEIDSVISKTKSSIEEYKKLKQSIITEVVTGKVKIENGKVCGKYDTCKDSGIEWIGEIPEEWEVRRTKFIANSMHKGNGITKEQIVQDGDSSCVRYGEIYSKYDNAFYDCMTRTNKSFYNVLQYFSFGDILFACTGELPEEIGKNIVYLGNEKCLAGGDIIVLSHSQEPRFLNYVYNSYGQTQKSLGKTKLKVVHISATEIANIFVALPSLPEQQKIADFLDNKCSEIDSLIAKKEQLVAELETYKKSLIYEVVTGKRSV